ncbi:MAG: hypothetical protein L3J76_00960 [Candidatus Hydrothermae bacterium]|nr:hypothetical protein [Candidatus Hydrothermae bacterium]
MRLDRFLVESRIVKRRSLAKRWLEEGRILREGGQPLKPSTPVRAGLVLWIGHPRAMRVEITSVHPLRWEVQPLSRETLTALPGGRGSQERAVPLDRLIPEEDVPFL